MTTHHLNKKSIFVGAICALLLLIPVDLNSSDGLARNEACGAAGPGCCEESGSWCATPKELIIGYTYCGG